MPKGDGTKFIAPSDWQSLTYCAPYYIHYPDKDRLQIWIKPRHWFAVTVMCLVALWVLFIAMPYDSTVAFIHAIVNGKGRDFANILPYLLLPLLFISGMLMLLYKRTGLIEISAEGVTIVENPRISPGSFLTIPRENIVGFEKADLYVRLTVSGYKLMLVSNQGTSIELIKIWGRDASSQRDFALLQQEIEQTFNRLKKTFPAKPKTPLTEAEKKDARAAVSDKQYTRWEIACAISISLLFLVLVPIQAGFDSFLMNSLKWGLLIILATLLAVQLYWITEVQKHLRRAILLLILMAAAGCLPFPIAAYLRKWALADTDAGSGWIYASGPNFGKTGKYTHSFSFNTGQDRHEGDFQTDVKLEKERPVVLRVSKRWSRIYEVDIPATIETHKKW